MFGHHLFGLPTWVPLSVIGIVSWGTWIIRQVVGAGYRPARNDHRETTSLVVPVYREDPEILRYTLRTWLDGHPEEIVLVIDHSEHDIIELAEGWARDDPRIKVVIAVPPGKRHALVIGMRAATNDVVVLTDSDTVWTEGFLPNLLMAFEDPRVAGVGCRQNVFQPDRWIWRRIADWMLDVRFLHFLPATARFGAIPCISGRTAAYRRSVVLPLLDDLEFETFWGRPCISGDDGRLTWLILREGWRASYQSSARALTVFPNTFNGFVKQRVRWSRNSYRCYFRAVFRGWMFQQPVMTTISVFQNLLGPFALAIVTCLLLAAFAQGEWLLAFITMIWLLVGRGLKGIGHLIRAPWTFVYLPLMTLVFIAVMIPVKFYALFTMNKQGWLTRKVQDAIAEGQSSETFDLGESPA